MDYKNTPEGRSVQSKYGKILHASRPEPPHNHPRMPMSNRAKIFSPLPPYEAMRMRLLLKAEIISKETESSCLKKASKL